MEEADNILHSCYLETEEFLIKHKQLLEMLSNKLIEKKTLFKSEVEDVIAEYEKIIGHKII